MICRKMAESINKSQEIERRMVFFGSKGVNQDSKKIIYDEYEKKFIEYYEGAEDEEADYGYDYSSLKTSDNEFLTDSDDRYLMVRTKSIYKYEHDSDGDLVIYRSSNKVEKDESGNIDSYANSREAVSQSLIQRLSLIEGELYHYTTSGFPSFKKANKNILDSYVIRVILNHPEVRSISSYQSKVENRIYYMNANIVTIYGELSFSKKQYM